MEYWRRHLTDSKEALRRAYRVVELFPLSKRYEYGVVTLHKERRRQLNLTNLSSSQDFPKAPLTSPEDKSRLLGKLCLFHPDIFTKTPGQFLRYRSSNSFFWLTFCIEEYRLSSSLVNRVIDRIINNYFAAVLSVAYPTKTRWSSPGISNSSVPTTSYVCHYNDSYKDYVRGAHELYKTLCKRHARKAAVWGRMRGAQDYDTVDVKQDRAIKTALETIEEE